MEIVLLVAGALLGFLFERSYDSLLPRLQLRRLRYVLPVSEILETNEVYVRPSLEILGAGAGGKSKRAYTHSCETIALSILSHTFLELPIKLRFSYNEVADLPNANWIVLGLSRAKSKVSEALLANLEASTAIRVVKGPGSHQYFSLLGQEFRCEHVPDSEFESRVTKDFGIICRAISDTGNAVLLCGGIHMFGTQAALEVALSEPFISRVKNSRAKSYAQLVEVTVRADGITIDPSSIRWQHLPLIPFNRHCVTQSDVAI